MVEKMRVEGKDANSALMEYNGQEISERLSGLYDISNALNSTIDVSKLLEFMVQQLKMLLDVAGVSVLFHDQQKDELYFPMVAAEEEIEARLKQLRFPTNCGIAGWVFSKGVSAIVSDVSMDERFYKEIDENMEFATRSILCVPIRTKDGVLGVLEAVNKRSGEFTEADQYLLEAVADNVAVSMERAHLHRDLQRAEVLLRRQNTRSKRASRRKYQFRDMIGSSDSIMDVLRKAEQVALTDSTVLICGETGTGKDLLARSIHRCSPRFAAGFVPINCAAIPESLLESELFGHKKGAFTSAIARRIGRFEEANGGTLFLDEIGDMPLNLQVKLLRVLEEDTIRPLGGHQDVPVDVRVIAATHEDLGKLVAEERFRQDLYYRLKVFEIELPPLRERKEDIALLIDYFIAHYNEKLGRQIMGIDDTALEILCDYDYPGNVRELRHFIESAMIVSKEGIITIEALPKEVQDSMALNGGLTSSQEGMGIPKNNEELKAAKAKARQEAEERVERAFLKELLSEADGNVSEAARKAEMNRSWLSQLVSKHQLDLGRFRKGVSW